MVSQTFVAREIFSAIWNLGILGALQASKPVQFPFDEQLQKFVQEKSLTLNELLRSVESICGFSNDVMLIATESRPGNGNELSTPYDYDRLTGEMLLATRESNWLEIDYDDHCNVDSVVRSGKEIQLIALLDRAIQARFSFKGGATPFAESMEEMLEKAAAFARAVSVENGSTCGVSKQIVNLWIDQSRVVDSVEIENECDYEKWKVEVAIPEMA